MSGLIAWAMKNPISRDLVPMGSTTSDLRRDAQYRVGPDVNFTSTGTPDVTVISVAAISSGELLWLCARGVAMPMTPIPRRPGEKAETLTTLNPV